MSPAFRRPIDGTFKTWSDGQRVHLLLRLTGGNLGPSPVTMHTTTELEPARALVRRHFRQRNSAVSGDPTRVERIATRVGAFSALRRLGRAAGGAVSLATAPARALGGAGVSLLKATGNVAKGVESTAALTAYVTKPLAWRPGKKRSGPPAASARDREPDADQDNTNEEEPMNDETSGNPRPQEKHVRSASMLLRRARFNPPAARHVQTIAKAAAQGHPGAKVAQAAITEARRRQAAPQPAPLALPPMLHSAAFPAWAKGAA
jgi:hypothetical protein